ncbi:hypothetical protein B0H34DRAFT_669139 [Crassisporium funariophilum]|nr:hypothetical protein B0H34DRAFT_669139 [Crassisporium funariophilum]
MEVDDDDFFEEEEWIGRGRVYDWANLPGCVTSAKNATLAIPQNFVGQGQLPKSSLSVMDFLSFKLPRLSSEIISSKTSTWFSTDKPNTDVEVLLLRPIPSSQFIHNLDAVYGQAWLDGAKSVVDQRFNDGADRLPLWALTFWKEVILCHKTQALWKASVLWLDREESKTKSKTQPEQIQQVRQILMTISWNSTMSYCKRHTTTLHLANFFGTVWLSDEHINMMVEELNVELSQNPKLKLRFQVADLYFALKISKLHKKTSGRQEYLANIANQANNQLVEQLYFPLHVNTNHWIAGMIDFKRRAFSFGDSLYGVGKGSGAPTKFIAYLQTWLKQAFGKRFKNQGNMLPHATQEDMYSCSIITLNTIEHAVLDKPLWNAERAATERLSWFIQLAPAEPSSFSEITSHKPDLIVDSDVHCPRTRLGIAGLLNPLPNPPSQLPNYYTETDSNTEDGGSETQDDHISMAGTESVLTESVLADFESDYAASSLWEGTYPEAVPLEEEYIRKRTRDDASDSDSGSSYFSEEEEKNRSKKYVKAGEGSSKSAVASRTLRKSLANGTYEVDAGKFRAWKDKILATDPGAEFLPGNFTVARHSICGTPVKVKEPYDFVRWKKHLEDCNKKIESKKGPKFKTPSLFTLGFVTQSSKKTGAAEAKKEAKHQAQVPCPGITEADNPNIVQYLQRTGDLGGGGRSLPVIAQVLFGKLFSELKSKLKKQKVVDLQMHEWKWRNDHANLRAFSASCQKKVADRSPANKRSKPCSECHTVLHSKAFKNATRRPIPTDKNIIFVNSRFRNPLLGKIYARTIGVREIVEDQV